jgi:hypothetical protein
MQNKLSELKTEDKVKPNTIYSSGDVGFNARQSKCTSKPLPEGHSDRPRKAACYK